jgi:hypothetical protein
LAFGAYGVDSGAALVVDRLVGFLFVYTRRTWLSQQDDAGARSWCGALQDPAVGPAVRGRPRRPGPRLDCGRRGAALRVVTGALRPAVSSSRRRATARLRHPMAHDRGGPARAGRAHRQRRPPGRLPQRVRLRQGVQASPRCRTWPTPPSPRQVTSLWRAVTAPTFVSHALVACPGGAGQRCDFHVLMRGWRGRIDATERVCQRLLHRPGVGVLAFGPRRRHHRCRGVQMRYDLKLWIGHCSGARRTFLVEVRTCQQRTRSATTASVRCRSPA